MIAIVKSDVSRGRVQIGLNTTRPILVVVRDRNGRCGIVWDSPQELNSEERYEAAR